MHHFHCLNEHINAESIVAYLLTDECVVVRTPGSPEKLIENAEANLHTQLEALIKDPFLYDDVFGYVHEYLFAVEHAIFDIATRAGARIAAEFILRKD